LRQGQALSEIRTQPIFGDFGGMGWEWIANWYVLGGLFLWRQRIITWHVPAAVILTTIAFSLPFFRFLFTTRTFSSARCNTCFPADGVAFGVLLMNSAAPLIDRLTVPKPYGAKTTVQSKSGGKGHG